MQRLKENRAALFRIMRDERLNPNSRLVATLVSMYLDADNPRKSKTEPIDEAKCKRDKDLMYDLIRAQFINGRGYLKRTDPDAPSDDNRPSDLDKQYEDRLKNMFNEISPSQVSEVTDAAL